jgi:manganese oxidase
VPAGTIQFTVTNEGQMRHNLAILGESGQIVRTPDFAPSDGAQTLEVELTPGTYTIICNLPGHAQRGQRTEIVVK